MCRAVTCRKCGKTTWAGCGQHVSQVMAGVPASRRCAGHARRAGLRLLVGLVVDPRGFASPQPAPHPFKQFHDAP